MHQALFRFYEELNDFLPAEKRKQQSTYQFSGNPSIKDAIEAQGVPHTEIDLILVNGKSIDFNYLLQNDDFVSVYPVFESLDITDATHLHPKPLRQTKFILDVHLGKLAHKLRLLGFDTKYENHYPDEEIISIAYDEERIILTRDIGILKNNAVTRGYWMRSTAPTEQTKEIVRRFELTKQIKPFTRCLECNYFLEEVEKKKIAAELPPDTSTYYQNFMQCKHCKKVYWEGTHYEKMKNFVESILALRP